jgi:hypothetical protein
MVGIRDAGNPLVLITHHVMYLPEVLPSSTLLNAFRHFVNQVSYIIW